MRRNMRLTCVLAVAMAWSGLACDSQADTQARRRYVLVHGAWMGAWAWDDVAAGLRAANADVAAVELPAHGADTTGLEGATLDAYVAKVRAAVDAAGGPVILVGHSLGGVVVTATAELAAPSIAKLVYLGAYLPKDGQSLFDLAMTDMESQLGKVLDVDQQRGIARLPREALTDVFVADGPPGAIARLQMNYRDEPLAPFLTPVHTTPPSWGSVPKVYVYTKQDRAVSYALQQRMSAGVSLSKTATLDTGHSPFLSQPAMVVSTLLAL